jgi:two-component system chemotaxis response regulator CheB
VLTQQTRRPVHEICDGDQPRPGHAYVAPPDHHVVIGPDRRLRLDHGPRVFFSRPAIDVLFASAAATYQDRLLAVLLVGSNTDGAEGVRAVKAAGGRVLVQDETRMPQARMPLAAVATRCVDFVLPLPVLAHALVTMVMVPGAAALFSVPHNAATT